MPYLKSAVVDLGLPDFFNHLIPIVEASLQTPVSNTFSSRTVTTGTISPGVIWVGLYYQVGIEALIPVNRQSGTSVGVIAQLHLYLDDIFPYDHRPADIWQHHRFREADVSVTDHETGSSSSLCFLTLLLPTVPVLAHAMLDRANPRVGSSATHRAA